MQVKRGDRVYLDYTRATAEPADEVVLNDYYTRLPQMLVTGSSSKPAVAAEERLEVSFDDQDIGKLVECAIRHPAVNMRSVICAAIWNHPESFREIFRFGLRAPPSFPEISKIVAEELDRHGRTFGAAGLEPDSARAPEALLPRMPLPAHLRRDTGE